MIAIRFGYNMSESRFAIVVVTYFPDPDVLDQLEFMADLTDGLFIVDNTPGRADFSRFRHSHVSTIYENGNQGLAKALNDGVLLAGVSGFQDIFLFDQDSKPDNFFLKSMLDFKRRVEREISNCAFCVPSFYDRNSGSYSTFPLITTFTVQHRRCHQIKPFYNDKALISITSGTLISFDRFKQIGPFPEDYFIDFIDNEYCLRAAQKNLCVAVNCEAILNHAIGQREKKRLFCVQIKPNHHPPKRRYFIARNGIYTARTFFRQYPSYFFLIVLRLIHEVLSVVLYEQDKSSKLKAIYRGLIHGWLRRMGDVNIAL
jgi:rhamnosyltransferase